MASAHSGGRPPRLAPHLQLGLSSTSFEHFAVYYVQIGWEWERNAGHLFAYGRDTPRIGQYLPQVLLEVTIWLSVPS